jgi:hypothetical protein
MYVYAVAMIQVNEFQMVQENYEKDFPINENQMNTDKSLNPLYVWWEVQCVEYFWTPDVILL